jgi:DNA phosphorothioation-associated putative methyltransferase
MPARQAFADGIFDDGSLLDYGSGRGQDVARLAAAGVDAHGWDPYYADHRSPEPADHVLLVYVLNVIEDPTEREHVLEDAWRLARRTLIVATRLSWDRHRVRGQALNDGTVTSRQTFQHLFHPTEARRLVERVTSAPCLSAAPGLVYAFRDDAARLSCLSRRTLPAFSWGASADYASAISDVVRFYEQSGRMARYEELPAGHLPLLAKVPPHDLRRLAHQACDPGKVARGARRSTLDTLLLLAIALFEGRPRLAELPLSVQTDIRVFFGTYRDACKRADRLLLKLRDDSYVRAVMRNAVGKLTPTALYVHRSAVPELPVLLRIYEHCGAVAAGRPNDWTIVKLHHDHRQVSWLSYPNFDSDAHPALAWSYLVDLRSLHATRRDYRSSENPPVLHRKHEFLTLDHPHAEKYRNLTEAEMRAGLYRSPEAIGTKLGWQRVLADAGKVVRGHRLIRETMSSPDPR